MESSESPFYEKTDGDKEMEPDSVCIARGTDGFWSRGKVLSKTEDSTLEVFFLDYGFTEFISIENVKPLPREFAELPCQAIECSLAHILPEAMEWSKNTIDIMCDQAYTVKEKKTLCAKVLNRVEPIHTMGQKLELELFDNRGVQFAQELIWRQEALPRKKTENLEVLIGKPALKNQMFFNPVDKVAYLSAQIYWIENDVEAIKQAEEILLLLSPRDVGWDANLEQRGVLLSVLKIIGYIKCERAHGLILRGVTSCCRESARICEICIDNNLIPKLVYCLEQDSRTDIRLQAIESIVELSQQNKFVTACCEDAGSQLIFILSLLLESFQQNDEPSKTIKLLCKASAEIIKESRPETCKDLKKSEIVDLIFKVVSDSNKDDNDKEPWLELLSSLAKCKSMHPLIIRESFLNALTSLLKDTSSQTALCYALATLQDLVYDNRKNKRILLEHKLVILLNDLVDSGVTSPALEMCRELQGELTLQLPQQEVLAGIPAQSFQNTEHRIEEPKMTWIENCFKIHLTVYIKEASRRDFQIGINRITINSFSEGVQYSLDWELFGRIVPTRSEVTTYSSNVIIKLRKETDGKWGRLRKDKFKPACLTLDFDKLYLTEDEEELDDDVAEIARTKESFKGVPRVHIDRPPLEDSGSDEDTKIFSDGDDEPNIDYESFLLNNFKET